MRTNVLWRPAAGLRWGSLAVVFIGIAVLFFPSQVGGGEPEQDIVRVEEDWELNVATADENSIAPQVTMAFSPFSHVEGVHATFELNHRNLPEFEAGGMQVQLWDGEWALQSRKFPHDGILSTDGESIMWTQALELTDNRVIFEVTDGSSQTWGNFGGQGYLRASRELILDNLNGYDPYVSVSNSGVGFAANRVDSLILKEVRRYTADGQVFVDANAKFVDLNK